MLHLLAEKASLTNDELNFYIINYSFLGYLRSNHKRISKSIKEKTNDKNTIKKIKWNFSGGRAKNRKIV
jgi:hypothetical protein